MKIQAAYACVYFNGDFVRILALKNKEESYGIGYCDAVYKKPLIVLPDNGESPMIIVGEKLTIMFLYGRKQIIDKKYLEKYDIPEKSITTKKNLFGKQVTYISEGCYFSKEGQVTTYVTTKRYELSMPEVFREEIPAVQTPSE